MEKIIKDRCATAYTGGMILQQCGAKKENFSRFFCFLPPLWPGRSGREGSHMKKLEGKVALITGASKGIGEGIARVYAKYGAKLVLAARGERVLEFAEELRSQGYDAIGVRADVTQKESVLALVKAALDRYGTIDVLVNNAGVCILGDLLTSSDEDRDAHFDINIKGVWNVTRAVAPIMMMKKEGKIVIMSSVTGDMVADPGEAAYATSKAALVGFTKAVARELADYNITVNAI